MDGGACLVWCQERRRPGTGTTSPALSGRGSFVSAARRSARARTREGSRLLHSVYHFTPLLLSPLACSRGRAIATQSHVHPHGRPSWSSFAQESRAECAIGVSTSSARARLFATISLLRAPGGPRRPLSLHLDPAPSPRHILFCRPLPTPWAPLRRYSLLLCVLSSPPSLPHPGKGTTTHVRLSSLWMRGGGGRGRGGWWVVVREGGWCGREEGGGRKERGGETETAGKEGGVRWTRVGRPVTARRIEREGGVNERRGARVDDGRSVRCGTGGEARKGGRTESAP